MDIGQNNMTDELTQEEFQEMKEVFSLYDQNNDGYITADELHAVMTSLGQNPKQCDVERHISECDKNGDGRIDFQEFLHMMAVRRKQPKSEDELKKAFLVFDQDNNGFISRKELQRVMLCLGEDLNEAELDAMMREADTDGDGQVNFEEFKLMMDK